jgi:hypothetical protein
LLKETFRSACWQIACLWAEEEGEDGVQRLYTMARISEQCLARVGLLGRTKIVIEPGPDLQTPPRMRISMGGSRHCNN